MHGKHKLLLIDSAIRLLMAGGLLFWCFIIYTIATSGLPMMRQMLGCMLTTMAVFGLLSLSVRSLKHYKTYVTGQQRETM